MMGNLKGIMTKFTKKKKEPPPYVFDPNPTQYFLIQFWVEGEPLFRERLVHATTLLEATQKIHLTLNGKRIESLNNLTIE